ncbi:MAG: AI-2E family transporter [Acidobacteriota bacterium]
MNGAGTARTLSRLWMVTMAVVIVAVLYLGKVLLVPLAFAILFGFLLAPLVGLLERIHLGRLPAVIVVMLGFVLLLGAAGWGLFTQLVGVANDLPQYRDNITRKIDAIHKPSNSAFGRAQREIEHLSDQIGIANTTAAPVLQRDKDAAKKPLGTTPEHPVQVREVGPPPDRVGQLGGILAPMATALLTIVFTFFVLLQREDLRNRLMRLSGDRNLTVLTQAMDDASRRISRYFSLQLLVNTVYGSIIFTALHFIGLPHAMFFGALAGLARFIPYIGAPIAALLPTLLSLAVFHGWTRSLLIAGIFFCMEVITANFAEPRIYGRHTGLASLAILIAAAFWTLVWGPVGLALSIPITVCVVVMGRHIPSLEFLTILLGDKPTIPSWMCFYQRLLARDRREAGEILESAADRSTLEEAYDKVLVPALVLAEEDRLNGSLDEATGRFVRRSARNFVEELGWRENGESPAAGATEAVVPRHMPERKIKVQCIPARDETDELAATMLAQCLDGAVIEAWAVRVRRLDEVLRSIAERMPDVVFLCALPPVAITRMHRLYRAVQARHPELRVVVGAWNLQDDVEEFRRRATGDDAGEVITTLKDAVARVREIAGGTGGAGPNDAAGEPDSGRNAA